MTVKRGVDLTLALLAAVFLLPLALAIAAVLAATGDREVIFAQTRVGRGGRPFRLLKFVTMRRGSQGRGTLTLPGDARVLPFGRFLRRTKLNELPQLINVIRGEMSLVGPRPLPAATLRLYPEAARDRICEALPGITGVGSIFFRDEELLMARSSLSPEECYRSEIAPRKAELELWYLENRSSFLDLVLLGLTALVLVAPASRLHEWVLSGRAPRSAQPTTSRSGRT